MDQAVGKILDAVESRPDADDTLVLFFSDNGGIPRVGSSNAPYRGAKLSVYEGGTRVCAAIRWPAAGLSGGGRFNGRIGYIDVLPTLLAAVGAELPAKLDGVNILPALRGEAALPRRPWFSYIHQNEDAHASVHWENWKLVAHGDFFSEQPAQPPTIELYDLAKDVKESRNISANYPDRVRQLHQQLQEFGKWQKPGIAAYSHGRAGFQAPKDWNILQP